MNCNECKHYRWYYDYCEKWCCEVDGREVHNCLEPMETPILDAMTNSKAAWYEAIRSVQQDNQRVSVKVQRL